MVDGLFTRMLAGQDGQFEWVLDSSFHQGSLQELAQAAKGLGVILLLPATDVLLMEITLPVSNRRLIKKALPFAVEDWLSLEVDLYHLAWSVQQKDKIAVAAIAHERIKSCLHCFRQAHINVSAIYPETLFLPVEQGGCSVLLEQGRAVVRSDQWRGGGVDQDYLSLLLEKAIAEQEITRPIKVWTTGPCEDVPLALTHHIACKQIPSALLFLQASMPENSQLNLLSGTYSLRQETNGSWKAWLPALATGFLAIVVQYGAVVNSYWNNQAQLTALQEKNQQLFKQAFPDVKRIVNLKTQAQQELLALRKKGSHSSSDFLDVIYLCGAILKDNTDLQLQETGFNKGVLNLRVTASAIAQIEQFKNLVEKNQGVTSKILSAEANDKGVVARLEITRKPI